MRSRKPVVAKSALEHLVLQVMCHIPALASGGEQGPAGELGQQTMRHGIRQIAIPQRLRGVEREGAAPGEDRQLLISGLRGLGQRRYAGLDHVEHYPALV